MNGQPSKQLPWFSELDITSRVSVSSAIAAIETALKNGQNPAVDPARTIVQARHGQLLLMPSESARSLGVKIASVTPENPGRGLPRIQAIYLMLDSHTLTPLALMDGTTLTSLRTSAVSAVAANCLASKDAKNLLVFGSGPQARSHIVAMKSIRPLKHVSMVATTQPKAEELAELVTTLGMTSSIILRSETARMRDAVGTADLIVCATTSATPVFDGQYVRNGACVVAVGSHEPTVREVDASLVERSRVVVEDTATALRESGDIVMAIEEGRFDATALISLTDLVNSPIGSFDPTRPSLFKSSGMAWEDLIVAELVFHSDR